MTGPMHRPAADRSPTARTLRLRAEQAGHLADALDALAALAAVADDRRGDIASAERTLAAFGLALADEARTNAAAHLRVVLERSR